MVAVRFDRLRIGEHHLAWAPLVTDREPGAVLGLAHQFHRLPGEECADLGLTGATEHRCFVVDCARGLVSGQPADPDSGEDHPGPEEHYSQRHDDATGGDHVESGATMLGTLGTRRSEPLGHLTCQLVR